VCGDVKTKSLTHHHYLLLLHALSFALILLYLRLLVQRHHLRLHHPCIRTSRFALLSFTAPFFLCLRNLARRMILDDAWECWG